MIDWTHLLTNSLWLIALSAALAVLSVASWRAAQAKTGLRTVLSQRRHRLALLGCLVLFCLGVALSVQAGWERIAWAALALLAAYQWGSSRR